MFQYVNEVAVFGTTFFMMALATLWYSEYLFQKIWLRSIRMSKHDLFSSTKKIQKSIALMFAAYFLAVYIIAVVVGYAQVYGLALEKVTALIVIGFSALVISVSAWEQRPFMYYLVTLGFSAVFIIGSSFFLYRWPW